MRYTHAFTPITGLGVPATLCGPLHYLGSLCHSLLWHWPNPNREVTCINGANPEGGERLIVLQAATSGARRMPRQNSLCPRRQQSMLPGRGKWGGKMPPQVRQADTPPKLLDVRSGCRPAKMGSISRGPLRDPFRLHGRHSPGAGTLLNVPHPQGAPGGKTRQKISRLHFIGQVLCIAAEAAT